MDTHSTPSTWQDPEPISVYPALEKDINVDVVIIGGGITGIVSAYLLAQSGIRVAVLESETIGSQATAHTTAFVTHLIDTGVEDLIRLFGREKAQLIWQSGMQAIDEIENIIRKEGIDCDFKRCPLYVYGSTNRDFENLKKEFATARQLGFETFLHQDDTLHFDNTGSWEIPNQAKFHPLVFLNALAKKAQEAGVQIFEHSTVKEIIAGPTIRVCTDAAQVSANYSIVATQLPFGNPKITHFKKVAYTSYVIEADIPKGLLQEAMYVDSENPYHYVRVDSGKDSDRLIVGGEDHRTDIPVSGDKNFRVLEGYLQSLIPQEKYTINHRWSGILCESVDGLPFIGEYAPKQLLATAFSGNGMIYAMISAMIFRDHILGRSHDWASIYNVKRSIALRTLFIKSQHFIGEFFGGAVKNTLRWYTKG